MPDKVAVADHLRTGSLDWEDLRYFLALAGHGSLSAAARSLRVTHATVSRRVASLEHALGHALFERGPKGYALTPNGELVRAAASSMETSALAVRSRIPPRGEQTGRVRLTAARALLDGFLVRRMAPLSASHPGLDLEVIAESRLMSLARHEVDMALRFGRPREGQFVMRRVATLAFGFFGTPVWRERVAAGLFPPLVGYDAGSDFVAEAVWLSEEFADSRRIFRSNSQISQMAAASVGMGVALLPLYLAIGEETLVPIDLGRQPPSREVWLLILPNVAQIARVRAVADFIAELFRKEQPSI